jgi:hypothetical protein
MSRRNLGEKIGERSLKDVQLRAAQEENGFPKEKLFTAK